MATIGGLTITNPLQLSNTTVPAPTTEYGGGGGGAVASPISTTNTTPTADTSGSTSGATGSTTSGPTAAQLAAQALYNNVNTSTNNAIQGGINAGAGDYRQSILDYFNAAGGVNSQQNTINASAVQNELSRDQGLQGVRDMVNNGIQGGGVVLDNDNAGTSSAGDALARAYGIEGRQQASGVGRQYAEGQNTVANAQNNLNTAVGNFTNVDAPTKKADIINNIVTSANQSLTYLNGLAANAGVTDLPAIQDQIAQIKAQATAALSAYDGELATQTAANTPTTQEANQAKAMGLFTSGTAPANQFNFTSTAPATLQDTGPSASSLPIFIAPSSKNNLPVTA